MAVTLGTSPMVKKENTEANKGAKESIGILLDKGESASALRNSSDAPALNNIPRVPLVR